MALYYYRRQLLPQKKSDEIDTSCYMCYVCPDYCTNIDSSTPQPPPPPPPPPSPAHQVSTILVVMLCILGFALVFLSYLTIRRYRIRSRRNASPSNNPQPSNRFRDDENQGPSLDHPIWYIRTVGFPQSVIDTIAVFKYDRGEGLIEGSNCSICLNEFREDESLRLLPKCSHAFHVPCIDTWLRSHKNCPVCRAPVLSSSTNTNNNATRSQVISVSTGTRNRDSGILTDPQNLQEDESGDRGNGLEEETCDRAREFTNASCDHDSFVRRIEDGLLKNRVLSHLHRHYSADHQVNNHQPLRRSVSMDFMSSDSSVANDHQRHPTNLSSYYCQKRDEGSSGLAVIIVEKQHDLDIGDGKRLECSNNSSLVKFSSHGRSTTQRGPVLMKRSFSFSGRRSLWKHHIKSVESISIPEV